MKLMTVATMLLISSLGISAKEMSSSALISEAKAGRGGARIAAIDFESSGDVSAFQMRLILPADAKRVDLSRCLKDLPAEFTGVCNANGNKVAVTVYSPSNKAAPAGILSVGKVTFVSAASGQISVDKLSASKRSAETAQVSAAKVESID
ncbi:MAG TPA: hypothetical protein PLB00_01045 [Pseudomonadota bacterium]|jgi:hypothetical protein|nr:hypothetical protein [Pseudomonadota bacterium]